MSISAITIENFKGIRESVRIELKPITLLFGPNSAGKSTIVQALHYAWEIFEQGILDPDRTMFGGESVDLGGFQNLVHCQGAERSIRLRFEFVVTDDIAHNYPDSYGKMGDETPESYHYLDLYWNLNNCDIQEVKGDINFTSWIEISIRWNSFLSAPFIHSYKIGFGDETFAEVSVRDDGRQTYLSYLNLTSPVFAFEDGSNSALAYLGPAVLDEKNGIVDLPLKRNSQAFRSSKEDILPVSDRIEFPGLLDRNPDGQPDLPLFRETADFHDLLCSLLLTPLKFLRVQLRMFKYIGPLRKIPGRNYQPPASYSTASWADGLAAWDTLFNADDGFLEKVNSWLAERLDTGFRVRRQRYKEVDLSSDFAMALLKGNDLDADIDLQRSFAELVIKTRLKLHDLQRDVDVDLIDVGVGLSQVLPIVVMAQLPALGVIAIEQPELHVHPALQVALGDLFIESVKEDQDDVVEKLTSPFLKLNPEYLSSLFSGVKKKVFLIETHSEHLLLRLLKRIRQTSEGEAPPNEQLTPAELGIHFIEQRNGAVCVSLIRVNEDGEFLDRWPRGFFTERAEELF